MPKSKADEGDPQRPTPAEESKVSDDDYLNDTIIPDQGTGLRLDLHVHSDASPDSQTSPGQLIDAVKAAGLHGLALTDHNSVGNRKRLAELARKEGLLVIPALEVSSRDGHVLAYGIDKQMPGGLPASQVVLMVQRSGGLAVAAHPFRPVTGVGPRLAMGIDFDGLETLNGHSTPKGNSRAGEVALSIIAAKRRPAMVASGSAPGQQDRTTETPSSRSGSDTEKDDREERLNGELTTETQRHGEDHERVDREGRHGKDLSEAAEDSNSASNEKKDTHPKPPANARDNGLSTTEEEGHHTSGMQEDSASGLFHLAMTGGSDAHTAQRVGLAWTEFPALEPGRATVEDVLDAMRKGQCLPGGRSSTRLALDYQLHVIKNRIMRGFRRI